MKSLTKTNSFQSSLSSSRNRRSSFLFPSDSLSINDIQTTNQQSINDLKQDENHFQRISSQRSRGKSFSSLKSIHENDLTNHVSIKFIPKHPSIHHDQLEKQENPKNDQFRFETNLNHQSDEYQLNYLWRHCDRTRCFQLLGCCFTIVAVSMAIAAIIFALLAYQTSLGESTITTTTSTTSTSTSTTSTTTTSTTSKTTSSTSSTTSTSTSSTTTTTTSTSATTRCSTTQMTTRITSTPLPNECLTYLNINNDGTRLATNTGGIPTCDQTLFSTPQWVRFTGSSGISLSNCPIATQSCGTDVTGWYSGVYPAIAGQSTEGKVCYRWTTDNCYWQNYINITNCNGFYVYYLSSPPICNARYCTM